MTGARALGYTRGVDRVPMNRAILIATLAVLAVPSFALAEMYKCKRPDGKTSFQDHPCEPGAAGSAVVVTDPSPPGDGPRAAPKLETSRRDKAGESRTPIADETLRQRNRELEARNRAMRCEMARRDLHVLRAERPVYSTNKEGKRVYVEDADRPAELAAAQRRVDEWCK